MGPVIGGVRTCVWVHTILSVLAFLAESKVRTETGLEFSLHVVWVVARAILVGCTCSFAQPLSTNAEVFATNFGFGVGVGCVRGACMPLRTIVSCAALSKRV